MKDWKCSRCGEPITVTDDFDIDEDMGVCDECDFDLSILYGDDGNAND